MGTTNNRARNAVGVAEIKQLLSDPAMLRFIRTEAAACEAQVDVLPHAFPDSIHGQCGWPRESVFDPNDFSHVVRH
jgi:hypothetical protein